MSSPWQKDCNGSMTLSTPVQLPCTELHVASWENKSVCWRMYESKILNHSRFLTCLMLILLVYYVCDFFKKQIYLPLFLFFLYVSVCVTIAPGEERRHRCIPEASYWRCEGCEGSQPGRMWRFAAAETGAQHQQLPAHSHTPSAECKRPSLWQNYMQSVHKHNQ